MPPRIGSSRGNRVAMFRSRSSSATAGLAPTPTPVCSSDVVELRRVSAREVHPRAAHCRMMVDEAVQIDGVPFERNARSTCRPRAL